MTFWSKLINFHSRKSGWRCDQEIDGHFVFASMCKIHLPLAQGHSITTMAVMRTVILHVRSILQPASVVRYRLKQGDASLLTWFHTKTLRPEQNGRLPNWWQVISGWGCLVQSQYFDQCWHGLVISVTATQWVKSLISFFTKRPIRCHLC